MDETRIRQEIEKHEFYHVIQLTETISTPGWKEFVPSQQPVRQAIESVDLTGKRFLDIGCRDGMFSFQAERQGAEEVIGVDNDLSIAATEFLIPFFDSKVRMQQLSLLDLSPDELGTFDVALFAGVLYHLRYPVQPGIGHGKSVSAKRRRTSPNRQTATAADHYAPVTS